MRQMQTKPFPYYVGIYSLEELVTKESTVCVINILGNESRKVTPVSHEYSGGNVVAGVQYGRRSELETRIGNIPVYSSVRDVKKHGHEFDTGVIYLPPAAVSQAVWELVAYNKALKRIVIITEKVSNRDSMHIRTICQDAGVDVVGCNCLGVANAWDEVRIGGALGGDDPKETLRKGSVAIHSNSGNFTTTIAQYLRTAGFGISTAVSSGKDVYIHFAAPEFLYAAQNDPRTKVVVMYVEPGGYYEKQALEWIKARRFGFNKPIIACVTGRWKSKINRPCGHAGAMAGSGDDAESKEMWFDSFFEVPVFDPENPVVGKKGVRVSSIQQIPDAVRAVYRKIDEEPDFETTGDLSLKPWIEDKLFQLPAHLSIPVSDAIPPYDEQIREINKDVGASVLRQNMRNKSGASRIDTKTFVAHLHDKSVLELSKKSYSENLYFSLAKVFPEGRNLQRMNLLLHLFLHMNNEHEVMASAARRDGATPNAVAAAGIALIGDPEFLKKIREYTGFIIDMVREFSLVNDPDHYCHELEQHVKEKLLTREAPEADVRVDLLVREIQNKGKTNAPLKMCRHILEIASAKGQYIHSYLEFLIAANNVGMFWNPLLGKRMHRQVVEDAVTYLYTAAKIAGTSVIDPENNSFWKKFLASEPQPKMTGDFTETLFKLLFMRKANEAELLELNYLLGLTITNGPGTISAKGAKESVSARNHIPMAYVGFFANTGLAHGGNGFEAVAFLLDQFKDSGLTDPSAGSDTIDLQALANQAAKSYGRYKQQAKETGKLHYRRIPCVNHPVFKGNDVNIDPREAFIRKELETAGIKNIFLDFYHQLVRELFNEGVTSNVFCVNVDAVLAVITLKLIWQDLSDGRFTQKMAQDLVFILFLLGRTIGNTAEIADHRVRGLDMDCRTPQNEIAFVM